MPVNLLSKKYLFYLLLAAILLFSVSQYIASNYGLPQWITIQIKTEKSVMLDVFYDSGEGFEEKNKINQKITGSSDFQTIRLLLPFKSLKSIRIDPLTEQGIVYIESVALSSLLHRKHVWAPADMLKSFSPQNDIRRFEIENGALLIESRGSDPFFENVNQLPKINKIKPGYLGVFILFIFLGTFIFYSILKIAYFKFTPKFIAFSNIRAGYLIGFTVAFVLILNFQKLQLYFLSDDFEFLFKYQSIKDVFAGSAAYHLNPITYFFVFYLGNRLFGFNPLFFHIITLFLHILNILLVYKLAFTLFRSKWTSFAASLLFATYFMNYEVVNWITGAFYLLLATFYVSTLLLFIEHLQGKKTKHYVFFLLTFTLSLFTMEQGVTLLGVCIVLGTLSLLDSESFRSFSLRQKGLFLLKNSVIYILPFIIVASFFWFKHFIGQRFIVNAQTFETFIKTIYDSVWHLFIPYPYGISNDILYGTSKWNYRAVLSVALILIISYLLIRHFKKRSGEVSNYSGRIFSTDAITFFFLVSCIFIYVIPQSIATVMQARYFYVPSVFSSILLGSLLVKSLSALVKKNNHIRLMFHSWLVFFIAGTIPLNMIFLHEQYHYWQTASQITKNVIQDTKLYIPDGAQEINIYYVNMPDGVYGQKNFSWPNAYLFRNGIPEAFPLAYPQLKTGMVKAFRTADNGVLTSHEHQFMTRDQLSQLGMSKSNLLLEFDPTIKTIRKLAE